MKIFWPVFAAILVAAAVIVLVASKRFTDMSKFLWWIVDLVVGGIFIYAGVIKALDPNRFAVDIDNYKILPWFIGVRLAFYLPWLEILCGLALIARRLYFGGLSILSALISVFIVATVVDKIRGLDITCGCFGHASKYLSFAGHLALDFVLLIVLLLLLRSARAQSDTLRSIDV
jgi:putative oxidoreductase